MQYLLTQTEYDGLAPVAELDKKEAAIVAMRALLVGDKCVCGPSPTRWAYCDDCPLSDVGRRGPTVPTRELSRSMCDLHRRYSK